jgi:hypothetical protein
VALPLACGRRRSRARPTPPVVEAIDPGGRGGNLTLGRVCVNIMLRGFRRAGGLHRDRHNKEACVVGPSSEVPRPRHRGILLAALLAAGASLLLLWLPVYATESVVASTGASSVESEGSVAGRATLLETNGPGALPPLVVPIALAVVSLLVTGGSKRRVATYVCRGALVLFVIITGFSSGMFYIPSAIVMMFAIGQQPRPQAAA